VIFALPVLERRKVVPDISQWVATHAAPSDRIAAFRLNRWRQAFRFYVGRHVDELDDVREAERFLTTESYYCAMLRPAYEEFVSRGLPLRVVYQREGMWA